MHSATASTPASHPAASRSGTESAYQRHRYYGQRLDPATDECGCLAAHAAHNREQDRQRKLRIRRMALGVAS